MSEYMLGPPILFYISRRGGKKISKRENSIDLEGRIVDNKLIWTVYESGSLNKRLKWT